MSGKSDCKGCGVLTCTSRFSGKGAGQMALVAEASGVYLLDARIWLQEHAWWQGYL